MSELTLESARGATPDSRSLDGLAIALAVLACAAFLAARGILPAWSLPWCAGLSLFATSALPLLARCTPGPADPLKLAAFTLALSPVLAACVWGAWHLVLESEDALAATAATCALMHGFTLRRRVKRVPPTRARAAVVLMSALLATGAGLLLLRGNEPRLAEPAIVRASVALAIDRSLPPVHPWLAGEPWNHAWSADLLAAFTSRALGVAPTLAHALFAVLASLLLPVMLFFLASAWWIDARRSATTVVLTLGAGLLPLSAGEPVVALAPFLSPGPTALATAFALAGLACATHALRHGKQPWILLCALFHGFALCLDFSSAWPAALATALACLTPYCDANARPRLLLALLVASLPGSWQQRVLGPSDLHGISGASVAVHAAMSAWIVIGLVGALTAWHGVARERRAVIVLALCTAVVALAGMRFAPQSTNLCSAASLALFSLALPASVTLEFKAPRPSSRAWIFRAACFALAALGLRELARDGAPRWEAARRQHALLGETRGALEPVSAEVSAVDLRAALAALRADPRLREDRAVLLACPINNPYRKTVDLPPTALAACAGLPLYGDHRSSAALAEPEYQP
ncbi:MAG TPA: hypothetical protein VM509_00945, partial [Planctomycetota bacterium]|nr:hypothetical protein [Planctomycetota bacterium]